MQAEHLTALFQRPVFETTDNWKLSCPFHDEETPSFLVEKEAPYRAHCFGCGVSGSVVKLVSEYLSISKDKAMAQLDIQTRDLLRKSFSNNGEKQRKTREYPESSLAGWAREIHPYILSRGFTTDILKAASVRFDKANQRQVFPHRDREGKLLGAAGRSCIGQDPKWYFYWGYSKSRLLYMPLQQELVSDTLILVEGIFDYLWLYQNGITNVAAILGSRASSYQIAEIKSAATRYIIGLDNDLAGEEGSRAIHAHLKRNGEVQQVIWPAGVKDWMDLDTEQINEVLSNAKNKVQACF